MPKPKQSAPKKTVVSRGPQGRFGGRRKPQRELPPVEPVEPVHSGPIFDWRTFKPSMLAPGAHFADELTTYRDRLSELLEHEGEYVVIRGHDVAGIFPTRDEAIIEALNRFGNQPALVKQIVVKEPLGALGRVAL